MTDVMVPFEFQFHAPLQAHLEAHDAGSGLQP
jgi:hypothetical protein